MPLSFLICLYLFSNQTNQYRKCSINLNCLSILWWSFRGGGCFGGLDHAPLIDSQLHLRASRFVLLVRPPCSRRIALLTTGWEGMIIVARTSLFFACFCLVTGKTIRHPHDEQRDCVLSLSQQMHCFGLARLT